MVNKKILIAPILAVALVLSLTAAVSYLPLSSQTAHTVTPKNTLSSASTPAPTSQPGAMYSTSTNSSVASPTQPPVPAPTTAATPASVTQTVYFLPALFVIIAVVLGVVAVQVLFRERGLRKELNSEEE